MADRIDRRTFLKSAGIGALAAREALAEIPPGGQRSAPKPQRSKTSFKTPAAQVSGIPLGGIGAGSVEIRPDGYFDDWLVSNMGDWSPEQPSHEAGPTANLGPHTLQFFVRVAQRGETPQLRRLGVREDHNDLYSLPYALPVQAVEFDGKFPYATLNYVDDTLPVEVRAVAFAPVVPHDSRTSGTPGFTLAFKVSNKGKSSMTVSLMGVLQNFLATGAADRALANEASRTGQTTTLSLRTSAQTGRKSYHGSLALSVTGGARSHILGGYRWYMGNGGWGGSRGYGSAHYSFLHAYFRDGKLPSLPSKNLDQLLVGADEKKLEALPASEVDAAVQALAVDPFFAEFVARINRIDPGLLKSREARVNLLKEAADRLNRWSGAKREHSAWGDCALESTVELGPGQEREVRFVLSWYFPHHFSALGPELGHQYEHWFQDARDVNEFLVHEHSAHREATVSFAETLLSTSLAPEVAFSWGAQLSTLIKSSWWCKDGRFAIWEGLGCCGLHTTDITYQGSFPLIALYPDLQKQQVSMGAGYQRADGRIPHFFAPDLLHVDNDFERVDMNPQYVMMVCRDYLWTGDKEYLRANWPSVVRAMDSTQRLDADGDGIPDSNTRRNTYDQWDLEGSPAYICSLWLGALRSAVRLAEALGESSQADRWRSLLARASDSFVKRLWNGDYFSLWVSDKGRDECCMSDQLSGEWYTGMMGLGHSLPSEKILHALQSVFKYNFSQDGGLRNASYPPGKRPHFRTDQNLQAAGNWTGIEYANASLMMEMGLVDEGLRVVQSVHDRYARTGRRWNHVECGDHYFRAMSSWATLLALTGFRLDAEAHRVTVRPVVAALTAPWFVPTGLGVLTFAERRLSLDCRRGFLDVRVLDVGADAHLVSATLGGKKVALQKGTEFAETVRLGAGQTLKVRW